MCVLVLVLAVYIHNLLHTLDREFTRCKTPKTPTKERNGKGEENNDYCDSRCKRHSPNANRPSGQASNKRHSLTFCVWDGNGNSPSRIEYWALLCFRLYWQWYSYSITLSPIGPWRNTKKRKERTNTNIAEEVSEHRQARPEKLKIYLLNVLLNIIYLTISYISKPMFVCAGRTNGQTQKPNDGVNKSKCVHCLIGFIGVRYFILELNIAFSISFVCYRTLWLLSFDQTPMQWMSVPL